MGAFLDKPKTEKSSESGAARELKYGLSAMQGWRMEMEDAHVCITEFTLKNGAFFGVFDGHAGAKVSQYCAENLLRCIESGLTPDPTTEIIQDAIKEGFLSLDLELREKPQWASGEDRSGTTAITVIVTPSFAIWGNCGDSRGLVCRKGKLAFATEDHKPYNEGEKDRIEKAGGSVMMQRVNGSLAVSRALGDFDYKRSEGLKPVEQLVSPMPETTAVCLEGNEEFLFLACDGIYDVMSNEEIVEFILHRLTLTDKLETICSDLLDLCLNKNSRDNMSAILITFSAAPKVSEEAIKKNDELQKEAKEMIQKKIEEYVSNAKDSLDVDEPYVMQQLSESLPKEYEVTAKRGWISEQLNELRKRKFDDQDTQEFDNYGVPPSTEPPIQNPLYEKEKDNSNGIPEDKPADSENMADK